MANGLEKLERLFGGPKHRDRTQAHAKQLAASGPTFPAPSFMRPTSYHMTPRLENSQTKTSSEKTRSQSLPDGRSHGDGERPSSTASSSTLVEQQAILAASKNKEASNERRGSQQTDGAPMLSPFRFPEDSLFKNFMPLSGDSSPKESRHVHFQDPAPKKPKVESDRQASEDSSSKSPLPDRNSSLPDQNTEQPDLTTGSQSTPECPPSDPAAHISMLFKPIDFGSDSGSALPKKSEHVESPAGLMPAPSIISSRETSIPPAGSPSPTASPIRRPSNASSKRFSLFPKTTPPPYFPKPLVDSPPQSDNGDDAALGPITECPSSTSLPSPAPPTPRHSSELDTSETPRCPRKRSSVRETWGNRVQDPWMSSALGTNPLAPRSRLRKSVSEASLYVVTPAVVRDSILVEPTVGDFLALSDDDIAESLSVMSSSDPSPFLASKDTTKHGKSSPILAKPSAVLEDMKRSISTSALNPASGEVTPPYTPVDAKCMGIPSQPSPTASQLGAIMVADIAKRYNFDLVYVVSLWPNGLGPQFDPSRRSHNRSPETTLQSFGAAVPTNNLDSRITGRFLGAFGLSEFGSPPFPIITKTHLKALGLKAWKEYRCPGLPACPGERAAADRITRGWVCSFYTDSVPVPGSKTNPEVSPRLLPNNRGIVFAGYTKQRNEPKLPSGSSPEGKTRLLNLYGDAKSLVDALVRTD